MYNCKLIVTSWQLQWHMQPMCASQNLRQEHNIHDQKLRMQRTRIIESRKWYNKVWYHTVTHMACVHVHMVGLHFFLCTQILLVVVNKIIEVHQMHKAWWKKNCLAFKTCMCLCIKQTFMPAAPPKEEEEHEEGVEMSHVGDAVPALPELSATGGGSTNNSTTNA